MNQDQKNAYSLGHQDATAGLSPAPEYFYYNDQKLAYLAGYNTATAQQEAVKEHAERTARAHADEAEVHALRALQAQVDSEGYLFAANVQAELLETRNSRYMWRAYGIAASLAMLIELALIVHLY